MSPPSTFPAPLPSPALEPPSSNTEAQSGNATAVSSHAMSISSILLATDPPKTPPVSRNNSFDEKGAAEAPDTPQPIFTTSPVTDPASAITQAEAAAALAQFYLTRPRTHANDDYEAIRAAVEDESLNAALIDSAHAAGHSKGKGKGKGKDPELYDTHPTEDGSTEDHRVDSFTDDNAADLLSQLKHTEDETRAARVLLDLGTCAHESNVYAIVDSKICSESEDEGPLPSAARKIAFVTSCHGNDLEHFAHKGNAVFDLVSQRKQRSSHRRHTIEFNGEEKCHCKVVQESVHARYVEGFKKLGYERFEREDTVPLDDDAVDSPQSGRHGAAEHNSERYGGGTLSRPPKLNRKTIAKLVAEKQQWRPVPDPLMETDSEDDTPVPFTETVEPIRLPLHAEESYTRGSANGKAVTNPEASAAPNAASSPPSPGRRPSYTDRRSGDSYSIPSRLFDLSKTIPSPLPSTRQARRQKAITSPDATAEPNASTAPLPPPSSSRRPSFADRNPGELPRASDFVDCTKTISSPVSSARQARQKKPLTSSPLKRVESALEPDPTSASPEQHDQSAGRNGSAPRSRYRRLGFLKTFLYRAELRNERNHMGAQEPTPPKKQIESAPAAVAEAKAGPSTPKKGQTNAPLLTPPTTTCRKRKATTQASTVEGQAPSQRKKQKAAAAMPRRDGSLWYVDGEGNWLRDEGEDERRRRRRAEASRNHGVMVSIED